LETNGHHRLSITKFVCKFAVRRRVLHDAGGWCYSNDKKHPIKANPAKAGDAKPWVYRHESDHDRQAAEDHKFVCVCLALAYQKARVFLFGWLIHPSLVQPHFHVDLQTKEKSHVP
jgi:hypothetical protein